MLQARSSHYRQSIAPDWHNRSGAEPLRRTEPVDPPDHGSEQSPRPMADAPEAAMQLESSRESAAPVSIARSYPRESPGGRGRRDGRRRLRRYQRIHFPKEAALSSHVDDT